MAAEITDLLYAYHTPADAAASLLGLKELLITTGNDTVAAYQVLSASLVTGQRLDFVVAAPTHDAGAAGGTAAGRPAAELMRIVISEAGVFEVRGGGDGGDGQGAGSGRRLLQQLSNGQLANPKVQGQLSSTATSTCGEPQRQAPPACPPPLTAAQLLSQFAQAAHALRCLLIEATVQPARQP